jgi:hypothetical protein
VVGQGFIIAKGFSKNYLDIGLLPPFIAQDSTLSLGFLIRSIAYSSSVLFFFFNAISFLW